MLILVTGARGFIGQQLVRDLAARGHAVRACTRESRMLAAAPLVHYRSIDLGAGADEWQRALEGVGAVVHLAAQVHVMGVHDEELRRSFDEINAQATWRLAQNAQIAGVKRFVFVSSIKVLGDSSGARPFRSDDTPRPVDAYALSKLKAEDLLTAVTAAGKMEHIIVRPPLVYGPGVRANFRRLLALVYRGVPLPLAGIDNRRSLANVWNVTDLLVYCIEREQVPTVPLLVCDEISLSTPQLLEAIGGAMGRRVRLFRLPRRWLEVGASLVGRRDELARLTDNLEVDPAVAHTALRWSPPITMKVGLERTVRWFLEQRG